MTDLTTGADVILASDEATTVATTAEALNPEDQLDGGGGIDTLRLTGPGTYRLDLLAQYAGFEQITLINSTSSQADIRFRDGVDSTVTALGSGSAYYYLSTGYETIVSGSGNDVFSVERLGVLSASDSLDGGLGSDWLSCHPGLSTEPIDLTQIDISNIENLSLNENQYIIDNAVLSDVSYLYLFDSRLVTSEAVLDLRGKTAGNNTMAAQASIASTNASGTDFLVTNLQTANLIVGGAGVDRIIASGFAFTADQRLAIFELASVEVLVDSTGIFGGNDANVLTGTSSADVIAGGGGADQVDGLAGNDTLRGDGGDDTLYGGIGHDTAEGGDGNDTLVGDYGDDILTGGEGDDQMYGDLGSDILNGGAGDDFLNDSNGGANEYLYGGAGNDNIRITRNITMTAFEIVENYYLDGGDGENNLTIQGAYYYYVTNSNATVLGGVDRDWISVGSVGSAKIEAGSGDDFVHVGGVAYANVDLGAGDDIISISPFYASSMIVLGDGADIVYVNGSLPSTSIIIDDFMAGSAGDTINLENFYRNLTGWDGAADLFDAGFLRLEQRENGALLQLDVTGGANDLVDFIAFTSLYAGALSAANLGGWIGPVHYSGTAGGDAITGGFSADVIAGGEGDDLLSGLAGADTLYGGEGNDRLDGGAGSDVLEGGDGNDTYHVDAEDVVNEVVGGGIDTVVSSMSYSLLAKFENLTLDGQAEINATGNGLDNRILGNSAVNIIEGRAGNDVLDGGAGTDRMIGGAGSDTYRVDSVGDIVEELAGEGDDTVESFVTFTLGANLEGLTLGGHAEINGAGNDLANRLAGNDARNTLMGAGGDDLLDGGVDADVLRGGTGDDGYLVDNTADRIIEAAGEGADRVQSSVSFTLQANLEGLTLTGTATRGTGNNLANDITGNELANSLDGSGGADMMSGSAGSDTYYVDHAGDQVREELNEGTDVVRSSVNHTLALNVEKLVLSGAAVSGTGNDLANALFGTASANILDGAGGADTMSGGSGNDTYYIDDLGDRAVESANAGADLVKSSVNFTLGANVEKLILTGIALRGTGNTLANDITGNASANVLDGGTGADILRGAAGDDTYYVDDARDKALEGVNAGTDTVRSSVSYALGLNVEQLILTGTAANGIGNSLANILTGNASANSLSGAGGADTMSGGAGNDTYYVDNAGDLAIETAGAGTDIVRSAVSFTLGANLETLVLTGGIRGVGNDLANTLYGNTAANVLDGATGADTMNGGTGDDIYYVDNVGDRAVESLDAGMDKVSSSIDFTLGNNVEDLILTGTAVRGTGNNLANTITGSAGANVLAGGSGDDVMSGGLGNDDLRGGLGNDDLRGGSGTDIFHFETALSATPNVDDILDFSAAADTIGLDRSVFRGIAVDGTLAASAFHTGSVAHDADDRILYDKTTGHIYYDADGTGATAAVLFATVTPNLALTNADFIAYP